MFDWLKFVKEQNVEYVTSGPNVARGHIAVRCPFCGASDPSQHMSISLQGLGWACWRNREHRGKFPAKLIQALLSCSFEHAQSLSGGVVEIKHDFLSQIKGNLEPANKKQAEPLKKLVMPSSFREFSDKPSCRPYHGYIHRKRKYPWEHVVPLCRKFGVRYCVDGVYRGRIIFPVFYKGKLVSWTGRAVSDILGQRYRALTTDPEYAAMEGSEPALGPIGNYFLWQDLLETVEYTHTLVLVEGPFDALRINYFGNKRGIWSTCFFTNSPSKEQVNKLHTLAPRFKEKYIMLDYEGTRHLSLKLAWDLSTLGVREMILPGAKDPGELTQNQFNTIFPLNVSGT